MEQSIYNEIKNGLLGDTNIIFNGKSYRIFIDFIKKKSKFFNSPKIFTKDNVIELHISNGKYDIPHNVFETVLNFMYSDDLPNIWPHIQHMGFSYQYLRYLIDFYILWDFFGISFTFQTESSCKNLIKVLIYDAIKQLSCVILWEHNDDSNDDEEDKDKDKEEDSEIDEDTWIYLECVKEYGEYYHNNNTKYESCLSYDDIIKLLNIYKADDKIIPAIIGLYKVKFEEISLFDNKYKKLLCCLYGLSPNK